MAGDEVTRSAASGRKVQVRKVRKDGWTAKRRRIFLDHLAATCNVRQSERAAGMSRDTANSLRRRDPEFAAQWRQAIQLGYDTIEAHMLAETIAAANRDEDHVSLPEREEGDPVPPPPSAMDRNVAFRLLQQHREDARPGGKRSGPRPTVATHAELVAALCKRIAAVKRRYERLG